MSSSRWISRSLLCALCLAQAHVDKAFVERMKEDLAEIQQTHTKIKEKYKDLVLKNAKVWKDNSKDILNLAELLKDAASLEEVMESLKVYSEEADRRAEQRMKRLQEKITNTEKLLHIQRKHVDSLEEMVVDM